MYRCKIRKVKIEIGFKLSRHKKRKFKLIEALARTRCFITILIITNVNRNMGHKRRKVS